VLTVAIAAAAKSTSAWDQPGTLAFLVVFAMAVILYFLLRSFVKQIKKVNAAARLEAERADAEQVADEQPPGSSAPLASGPVIGPPAGNGRRRAG
jgi:hypothetical protein